MINLTFLQTQVQKKDGSVGSGVKRILMPLKAPSRPSLARNHPSSMIQT